MQVRYKGNELSGTVNRNALHLLQVSDLPIRHEGHFSFSCVKVNFERIRTEKVYEMNTVKLNKTIWLSFLKKVLSV